MYSSGERQAISSGVTLSMNSATSDAPSRRRRLRVRRVFKWLILLVALIVAAGLVLHNANSAADRARGFGQSQQAEDESSAARIAHIENGLLPAVVIKGQ